VNDPNRRGSADAAPIAGQRRNPSDFPTVPAGAGGTASLRGGKYELISHKGLPCRFFRLFPDFERTLTGALSSASARWRTTPPSPAILARMAPPPLGAIHTFGFAGGANRVRPDLIALAEKRSGHGWPGGAEAPMTTKPVPLMEFCKGTSRAVLCVGSLAFNFAGSRHGARCNRFESDLYRRSDQRRRALLCPPLLCLPLGAVLVMRRANPMTYDEHRKYVRDAGLMDRAWDYRGPGDDGSPFERKANDWGWLDGKPVAVDYANYI